MGEEQTQSQSQGKWVAEVYDFLKLFTRVGGTITGLLLAEAGWAILLGITATLAGKENLPVLGIPWPANGWNTRDIRLTTIYPIGAMIIGIVWVFFSNLYLYIWRPLLRFFRFIFNLLVQLIYLPILFITTLLSVPLLLIAFLLEWRWKKKQPAEEVKKLEAIAAEDIGVYYDVIHERIGFKPFLLVEKVSDVFINMIAALNSTGRIGLAPIRSYSAEEDFKAAKIPAQIFAGAVNQLRARFHDLPAFNRFSFEVLPAIPQVTTVQGARRIRNWLDFDSVLWGSYLSIDPPRIWLNLEYPFDNDRRDEAEYSSTERLDPFLGFYNWAPEMVVIEQDDPIDAYLALVIAIAQTMKSRRPHGLFLYRDWQYLDKLYLYKYQAEQPLAHIVTDILFALKEPVVVDPLYPTAKTLLLDIAGRWVSEELSESGPLNEDNYSLPFLEGVVEQCIRLQPENFNHYCRLAAIQCAQGKLKEAKKAMRAAIVKRRLLQKTDWAYFSAMADRNFAKSDKVVALSKAYVYASLAIASDPDRDYVYDELRKGFQDTFEFQLHAALNEPLSPQAQLLCELLHCETGSDASAEALKHTSRKKKFQGWFLRGLFQSIRNLFGKFSSG